MTKLAFALVAIVALTVTVAPSVYAAHEYCVIRNALGQTGITDGIPAYGWSNVSDWSCFATADAAERNAGTGKSAPKISGSYAFFRPFPVAIPRGPGEPFLVERLP